jgi:predicted RNase H-like HicB family nuclease
MAQENDLYTYRVSWSNEDKEYVGLCAEFPSMSWLAKTQEEAFAGIREVVGEAIADMRASGEPIPQPLAMKHFSGRFMVRVPPEVHRSLVVDATEAGVSLNRFVSAKLCRS